MNTKPKYKRLLLKVSGEALLGDQGFGIDAKMAAQMAADIKAATQLGCEIGVVVGGGNIFRGVALAAKGADRVTADHMGILATTMNALALRMAIEEAGVKSVVMSAVDMPLIAETFNQRSLDAHLEKGTVVVFAGGTGHPFFTTDTAAALRAAEMGADAMFKGTQVDGIYSADPKKDPNATRFSKISHSEILAKGLTVMDTAAVALARDNQIPVVVFSIHNPGGLVDILNGEGRCTIVEA
ncbi:MAG: UMP kinase [Rhizobiaceae bacterium]|nr:UMP kinase [Rhizobiaceae bacterium]